MKKLYFNPLGRCGDVPPDLSWGTYCLTGGHRQPPPLDFFRACLSCRGLASHKIMPFPGQPISSDWERWWDKGLILSTQQGISGWATLSWQLPAGLTTASLEPAVHFEDSIPVAAATTFLKIQISADLQTTGSDILGVGISNFWVTLTDAKVWEPLLSSIFLPLLSHYR